MLFIDAQNAGVSGDMFIAALLDMGATVENIERALSPVSKVLGRFEIHTERVGRGAYMATLYSFDFDDRDISYSRARDAIKDSALSGTARNFALSCFETLTEAESTVHGVEKERLHLHDVPDTISDFVAAAACLDELGVFGSDVISSPVNTGKGFFTLHNKRSTLPAPATVEILKGKPVFGDMDFELTTPTGASILVNLARRFVDELPLMKINKIGYGAGKNDLGFSNVLKLYEAEKIGPGLARDRIALIESNVDTATGEALGYLFERLFGEGALDVTVTPCVMKKNRPGHIIQVMCDQNRVEELSRILMEETGSLGVRVTPEVHRHVLKREITEKRVMVAGGEFTIRFKVAVDSEGRTVSSRPEFEDVKGVAQKTGLSFREVERILKGVD